MERIRIPNEATYFPVSLTDVMLAAPLASRLLLGATLPGRIVQMAALGAYGASALVDWNERRSVRRIDFLREFGADVHHLVPMPEAEREREVRDLAARLSDEYLSLRPPREEIAAQVDHHLTGYIAARTGQRVETSIELRAFGLAQAIFPFALGACDFVSGDVAIFRDTGILEPHVIAHEFCHRKGYYKELEAQVLAYLALVESDEPVLVQSALCERLHRDLQVLAGDDEVRFVQLLDGAGVREEIRAQLSALRPRAGRVSRAMKALYDERMKLTGQNGLSDYSLGFTNFLYTYERRPA